MAIGNRLGPLCAALFLLAATSCSASGDLSGNEFGDTSIASAATQICDQFGGMTVANRYIVNNNRFGSQTATQCIEVTDTGFRVGSMWGTTEANWIPIGYPVIFYGCHWGQCSPGTVLPMQLSQIHSARSSVDFGFIDGLKYNAAYDIWLDPRPDAPGAQQLEIMIFFNGKGLDGTPPDKYAGDVSLGGKDWQVVSLGPWGNGGRELIYTSGSRINSWEFDVLDFIRDARSRGLGGDDWYLTSVQAGLECYGPCPGTSVNSFTVDVS